MQRFSSYPIPACYDGAVVFSTTARTAASPGPRPQWRALVESFSRDTSFGRDRPLLEHLTQCDVQGRGHKPAGQANEKDLDPGELNQGDAHPQGHEPGQPRRPVEGDAPLFTSIINSIEVSCILCIYFFSRKRFLSIDKEIENCYACKFIPGSINLIRISQTTYKRKLWRFYWL